MTGGTEAGYRKVLAQFYKDAVERLPVFAALPAETDNGDNGQFPEGKFSEGKPNRKVAEQLSEFATQAHAIKSAAGTIGAAEVSAEAAELEAAGKAGDMAAIGKTLPLFHEHLTQLIEAIGKTLKEKNEEGEKSEQLSSFPTAQSSLHPSPSFQTSLSLLKEALEAKNMKEIDKLLEEIEGLPLDAETREAISAVSDKVLMGEYEEAITMIDEIDHVTGGNT
jgi:HPt (histidine-containing phosphotransfer) domain-containing protein